MTQRKFGSMRELTAALLHERLNYNPLTGVFTWRNPHPSAPVKAGDVAGCEARGTRNGYWLISLLNKQRPAHLLAWLYVYGELPQGMVDHIDGDRTNNRIANLREASREQNAQNRKLNANNTTGVKGVSFRKDLGKYQARVACNGKHHSAGFFDTLEGAEAAAKALRTKLHKEYARHV